MSSGKIEEAPLAAKNSHKHAHDHDHGHGHNHNHNGPEELHIHSPLKSITGAFFLNLFFTLIELVGGILTSSVAIIAAAIHDLGDTVSLGLAFYFEKISHKARDRHYSYGYRRFSLLAAVLSGTIVFAGSLVILFESFPRFLHPEPVKSQGMIGLAILGVILNGWAAVKLAAGRSHHEKILTWHLVEDAVGWGIVLVGAYFIYSKHIYWLDPAMACALALVVAFNVVRNLKSTLEVLLQKVPRGFDESKLSEFVKTIPGVEDLHDIHVWSIDGSRHVLSLHLVLNSDALRLSTEIKSKIQSFVAKFGTFHMTIETEQLGDNCHDNCDN